MKTIADIPTFTLTQEAVHDIHKQIFDLMSATTSPARYDKQLFSQLTDLFMAFNHAMNESPEVQAMLAAEKAEEEFEAQAQAAEHAAEQERERLAEIRNEEALYKYELPRF